MVTLDVCGASASGRVCSVSEVAPAVPMSKN